MLCDVVVAIVVGRMRPRSMPLAMLTMKSELHGLLFLSRIQKQKPTQRRMIFLKM